MLWAQIYLRLYAMLKHRFNVNLPGLGWTLRQFKSDFSFPVKGIQFQFDRRIASSYGLLPAGHLNERETYDFLAHHLTRDHTFIDVGANVGEMALLHAMQAKRVLAFEPNPIAADVVRRGATLNGF